MKKILVIKIGGKVIENQRETTSLFQAIKKLSERFLICIVHGGGSQMDILQNKLNISIEKVNGRRITDNETLELTKMTFGGSINIDLLSLCSKENIRAIGISGVDGNFIQVKKREVINVFNQHTKKYERVDFGYVGDIEKINIHFLHFLLSGGYIPLIACLGIDKVGQVYNINADTLSTKIAIALKAYGLIFISDVSGIIINNALIKKCNTYELETFIANKGITHGMIPKIENAKHALEKNVKNVQIIGNLQTTHEWIEAIKNKTFGTTII